MTLKWAEEETSLELSEGRRDLGGEVTELRICVSVGMGSRHCFM